MVKIITNKFGIAAEMWYLWLVIVANPATA